MFLIKHYVVSFLLLFVVGASNGIAAVHEDNPYEFDISIDPSSLLSTYFKIHSEETYKGCVKKSIFLEHVNYELYNEYGLQATGTNQLVTKDALYSWTSKVDIFDTRRVQVGSITGQISTLNDTKFDFYEHDEQGNSKLVAIAYLNRSFDNFSILSPSGENDPIARMDRYCVSTEGNVDFWKTEVYHPELIDDRLIRIFAAFIVDHQDNFRQEIEQSLLLENENY
jgi:hypothetical protein